MSSSKRWTDIDYAAEAVKKSLHEKFGAAADLSQVEVIATERTIIVRDGSHQAEGTRDDLLSAIRAAGTFADLWGQIVREG